MHLQGILRSRSVRGGKLGERMLAATAFAAMALIAFSCALASANPSSAYADELRANALQAQGAPNLAPGDLVYFGRYFQDAVEDDQLFNELENTEAQTISGTTCWEVSGVRYADAQHEDDDGNSYWYYFGEAPLRWYVLDNSGSTYTLISEKVIDNYEFYNIEDGLDLFWGDSTVRKWLNSDFLDLAFTAAEQKDIVTSSILHDVSGGGYPYGNGNAPEFVSTNDKVYLIDGYEIKDGIFSNSGVPVVAKGTPLVDLKERCWSYWLRGGCVYSYGNLRAAGVSYEGNVETYIPTDTLGIRPVIRVKKSASGLTEKLSNVCYKLSFDAQDDALSFDPKSIEVGKPYGTLPKATSKGYTFLGWYTEKSGGSKVTASTVLKNGVNKTVYAHWRAHKYTIKFIGSGGSGAMKNMTDLVYDKKYTLKANRFKKGGFMLAGWATSPKGAIKYTNKAKICNVSPKDKATVKLYAVWKKKPANTRYSISYKANGGTGIMLASKNLSYGKTYKLKKNTFKRNGYTFVGWSTMKGGAVKYRNTETVRNLAKTNKAKVKLYAVWVKNSNTAKIKKAKKSMPQVYGCIISGCNDRYEGHTINGATALHKKLAKNKIAGYTTKSKNIKLYGVAQPAPYKHQLDGYIKDSFKATTNDDISFVFYAGHGRSGDNDARGLGICTMDDGWSGYYSYSDFLDLLNENIKGRIILIVDACYSGGFANAAKKSPAKNRICVLAAAAIDEISMGTYKARMKTEQFGAVSDVIGVAAKYLDEITKGDRTYQCFTYAMMTGLGWQNSSSYPADLNKDKVVTCEELYAYANSHLSKNTTQSPQCYLGKLKNQILFG